MILVGLIPEKTQYLIWKEKIKVNYSLMHHLEWNIVNHYSKIRPRNIFIYYCLFLDRFEIYKQSIKLNHTLVIITYFSDFIILMKPWQLMKTKSLQRMCLWMHTRSYHVWYIKKVDVVQTSVCKIQIFFFAFCPTQSTIKRLWIDASHVLMLD